MGKRCTMATLAWCDVHGNYIASTWLCLSDIVVVSRPTRGWLLHKVEEVFMHRSKSVTFRPRYRIWLVPDHVISKDPAPLLHCDREASRNEQKVLFLADPSQRRLSAMTLIGTKTLAALLTNTSPPSEVGIADVYPHRTAAFQTSLGLIQDFGQVLYEPFWVGLQPEQTTTTPVPVVARAGCSNFPNGRDIVEEVPVVRQAIVSMTPVGGGRDYQVDRGLGERVE